MKLLTHIFASSLGKKYIMAVTGIFLFLFIVGHLLGNLQIFLGPEVINRYGAFLQSNIELLWPVRIFLLVTLLLHIWSAVKLSLENRAARPEAYERYVPVGASYSSRTMLMSGLIVFVFLIYHLLHFTLRVRYINLTGRNFTEFVDPMLHQDVYKMMIWGFSNAWVSGFYILGMALLCLHLGHGLSSMLQSLGWKNKSYGRFIDPAARAIAGLIFLGYISIPLAVLFGYGSNVLK